MLLRWIRGITPPLLALVLLIASLIPDPPDFIYYFRYMDKLEHFVAYAIFAFVVYICYMQKAKNRPLGFFLNILICSMYGGLIEILQYYTGRTPEWLDFLADILGSAAGSMAAGMIVWGVRQLFDFSKLD